MAANRHVESLKIIFKDLTDYFAELAVKDQRKFKERKHYYQEVIDFFEMDVTEFDANYDKFLRRLHNLESSLADRRYVSANVLDDLKPLEGYNRLSRILNRLHTSLNNYQSNPFRNTALKQVYQDSLADFTSSAAKPIYDRFEEYRMTAKETLDELGEKDSGLFGINKALSRNKMNLAVQLAAMFNFSHQPQNLSLSGSLGTQQKKLAFNQLNVLDIRTFIKNFLAKEAEHKRMVKETKGPGTEGELGKIITAAKQLLKARFPVEYDDVKEELKAEQKEVKSSGPAGKQ